MRFLIVISTLLLVAGDAAAEEGETTTPTQAQRAYNDRGVQHMFDGEFEQAAANFQSSLALGESNIAWLNYGRALFKLSRCHESEHAYDKARSAPAVASPTREEIGNVLTRFAEEWSQTCNARLTLECPDVPTVVRIGESEPFQCHGDPIPVVAGQHVVTVPLWDERFAVDVTLGAQPAKLSLQRSLPDEPDAEGEDEPGVDAIQTEEKSAPMYAGGGGGRRVFGAVAAATGLAAIGTSLVLEAAWVSPRFDAYESAKTGTEYDRERDRVRSAQTANRVILFSGIGLTAIGTTLYLLPNKRGRAGLSVHPQGAGVAARYTW